MARAVLKYGNYSSYLYVDYNFSVSGRSWTLTGGMYFYTGTVNMGSWSNAGSTYLHTNNSGRGLAYTPAGNVYTVVDNFTIATGTYNDNGDAPSVSVGWSWGVNSSWGGYQRPSGTVTMTGSSIGRASFWNDINAYKPDGSTQNGLIFDLRTSDGGVWKNLTNEPGDFTKVKGTTATISNIRPNVTGAHYAKNSVTNNNASSFTWTFNSPNYVVHLYSAWNTHTMTIRRGTGIADITAPAWTWTDNYKTGTVTYGQSFNINASLATGYHWGNWTGSFTTDTQNYTFTIGDQDYDITANGVPNTYTIAYDANGGNNPPSNQTKTYDSNLTLSSDVPTRSNYDFLGWSTDSAATSATYSVGQVLSTDLSSTQDAIITLYAVWRETKPSNLVITGTANGPFEISLNWSATGLNCNYIVYVDETQIYSGTNTSFTYSCAEETTYNIYFTATNAGGTTTSSTISITTPADQAKIRIKKDGVWKKGKVYYKKDGQWIKAKKIYIKVDGKWKINNNYDS